MQDRQGLHLEVADAVVHGQGGQVRARQVDGARRVVVLHQPAGGTSGASQTVTRGAQAHAGMKTFCFWSTGVCQGSPLQGEVVVGALRHSRDH